MALEVLSALVALKTYDPQQPVARTGQDRFVPLMRKVLQALGVAGNPKAVAAAAERIWAERQRPPPQMRGSRTNLKHQLTLTRSIARSASW